MSIILAQICSFLCKTNVDGIYLSENKQINCTDQSSRAVIIIDVA